MSELTYVEAIGQGIWEELERDPSVFVLGEDVGSYGGAFRVTAGMLDHFGPARIRDTPISESAIVGAASGAAMMGMRPVVEMQFIDFISSAFNMITNFTAKARYRSGVAMSLVIRGPSGGGVNAGPFHSQNVEAYFHHTPGLKIVQPSTVRDAKGLIKSAIRDPDPVLYLEHKYLYRRLKDEIPEDEEILTPIGKAAIRRDGDDLCILSYGAMVHLALAAAEKLEEEDGLDVSVVDLRTLCPLDDDTILERARSCGRILLLHEATRTGGLGAELSARIAEHAFEWLDAPLMRLCPDDTPVPYSPPLEEVFLPSLGDVLNKARELAAY
ncbi:MAG TPA: alpha-ketoacid dehydrogenase subunit beta [Candidatus Krumholzibacteria bacterium]|jgi:2-oxoisovalerate dehydrogenase E1 component beta subunit